MQQSEVLQGPHRVGFVLCSPAGTPIPSTRIAVLNMLPALKRAGFESSIVFEPPTPTETPQLQGSAERVLGAGCDVVVFQKVRGSDAVSRARRLAQAGVPTVYAVCDLIDVAMVEATTATVTVTEHLRSRFPVELQPRIHVVHDGIERPEAAKADWGIGRGSRSARLSAVLVTSAELDHLPVIGSPPRWLKVRIVGRYASGRRRWSETRWKLAGQSTRERLEHLRFLLDFGIVCVPWEAESVYREMHDADIGIIPIDTHAAPSGGAVPPAWQLKSENRLTMKMSMGLPVVTTPIPSYEAVIDQGVNGFFASSSRDWSACLNALRDPARRREMGAAARLSVARRYSMDEQAAKLVRVLTGLITSTG